VVDPIEREEVLRLGIGVLVDPGTRLVGGAAIDRVGHRAFSVRGLAAAAEADATTSGRPCYAPRATLPGMDELIDRLTTAAEAFRAFRGRIEAGEPWPLSPAYGTEPESDWGPKETLAHVDEMIPFWLDQVDHILATGGPEPVAFGRTAADPDRIGRIGRDRKLPAGELFDRFDAEVAAAADRIRALPPEAAGRLGRHVRLGDMAVVDILERFVVHHLDEHARQLGEIVDPAARAG
jgi:hypothetical protein